MYMHPHLKYALGGAGDFERVLLQCLKVPASQVTANSEALFYEELLDINPYAQVN